MPSLTKTSDLPKPVQAKIDGIVDKLHDLLADVRATLNDATLPDDSEPFTALNQLENVLASAQRLANHAARN